MNDDCYYYIISFLDIKDNIKLSLVNKSFHTISKNEILWKIFYNITFYNIKCDIMFYHNYKLCYILNTFLMKYGKEINNINNCLNLSFNKLQLISPEISQLHMLQTLCLDNNQLQLVPQNINRNIIKII